MKKSFFNGFAAALLVVGLLSFVADNMYTFRFTDAAINKHYNNLSYVRKVVDNSNLPHNDVVVAIAAIDSLQADIASQYKLQLEQNKAIKK